MTEPIESPGAASGSEQVRPAATLAFWRDLLVVGAVAVAALYFGRGLLVPLAIALLLFVLLTAMIDRIAGLRISGRPVPGWLAHVAGIGVVVLGLAAILSILSSQAQQVAEAVPRYQARFSDILAQIVAVIGEDNATALREALSDLDISGFAATTVNTAGSFLSGLFLVLLYIPFMMLERHPMKSKIAIAAPDPELGNDMSKAVRSISLGLQRYVGIKTSVSALTGILSYIVMRLVGLDFAETWGVLAFALNFIPTIGSIVGVIIPSIVALVQFETLTPFLVVALGCGAVQFTIGNIVEPSLTGKSLNLSPLMVILALTLWSTLWGIPGAFLSVPLTVCAMIILSHVPGARWAAVLMSKDGNLSSMEDDPSPHTEEEGASPGKPFGRPQDGPAV